MSENNNQETPELIVNVKKKDPKFKAGSELASSVNMIDVDWDLEETENSGTINISLRLG